MYNRSSNSKTQDLLPNDTTQKRVSNDSTQVPVVEKSNLTDFIPNTVSVDTTQNPAPASSSLLVSQLPAKKPTEKTAKRKLVEKELAKKEYGEENSFQVQKSRSKRQRVLSKKAELNKKSDLGAAKVERSKKRKHQDKDEEIEDMPKKKVTRRTKAVVEKEKEEKRKQEEKEKEEEERKEEEDEEVKMNRLLQSKNSFLTEANLRELIPQWIKALPEEERLELAPLLPEPDRGMNVGGLNHMFDAADQWQIMLSLGGFEDEPEAPVLADSFKDENYERNWGERVSRDRKTKARARPKKYK